MRSTAAASPDGSALPRFADSLRCASSQLPDLRDGEVGVRVGARLRCWSVERAFDETAAALKAPAPKANDAASLKRAQNRSKLSWHDSAEIRAKFM